MSALYKGDNPDGLWAKSEFGELVLLKAGKAAVLPKAPHDAAGSFALNYRKNENYHLSLPSPYFNDAPSKVFVPDGTEGGFIVSRDSIWHIEKHRKASTAVYFPNEGPWHFVGYRGKLIYFSQTRDYIEIGKDLKIKEKKISGDTLKLSKNEHLTVYWNTASQQLFIYANQTIYHLEERTTGALHSTLLFSGFDFEQNDIITAFYLQPQRQLLLGSATKGLFVLSKKDFNVLGTGQFLKTVYYNQTLLPNGLLVTDYGAAFDQNGSPYFSTILQDEPKYGQILGPDGNLWILQPDNLRILSPKLDRIIERKPFPGQPRFAFRDHALNYWFGDENGLLLTYDASVDTFHTEAQLPSKITYLERKSDNELLIGTISGLFVFNTVDHALREIGSFKDKQIRSIRNESDHRYWVTTYQNGFFLYEDKKTSSFPLDKNGYLATAHCTLEDKNGFLWISTNKGLFKVSKRQLLDYIADTANMPYYFYYDKQSGFNTNEFNGGCEPCALQLPNGDFSFPSLDGLVQFNPLATISSFPNSPIILDEVLLDNSELPIKNIIDIPNHFSRLDIKIATPFYGNPYNLEIEYIVNSEDSPRENWLPLNSNTNTLSINELSSGNHQIMVRMRKGIGPQDFQYATFSLYIPPFFYETTWFAVLFCILTILTIWLIIYARTRFILSQNRWLLRKVDERTDELRSQYDWQQRLSASITHDIRTPLNYLVKALQHLKQTAKTQDFLSDEMEQIYRSAEHIYHYSNNLTRLTKVSLTKEWLKFSEVCLHSITQQQIDAFTSLAMSRGNAIYNCIPADTVVHSHTDILSIILHNVLDNAIKFTKHGQITLSIENETASLVMLRITDTGAGLHPEQIESYNNFGAIEPIAVNNDTHIGLGLLLVKDMARLIQMASTMESVLGRGTTVTFRLHRYNH